MFLFNIDWTLRLLWLQKMAAKIDKNRKKCHIELKSGGLTVKLNRAQANTKNLSKRMINGNKIHEILWAWPEGAKRPRLTRKACQPGHARLLVTRAYKKRAKKHVLPLPLQL